jgi:hypothetical protein
MLYIYYLLFPPSPSPGAKLQKFLVGADDDDIETAATSRTQAGRQAGSCNP